MIHLKAPCTPCRVFIGREEIRYSFEFWALWNGGPGLVRYFVQDYNGHPYVSDGRVVEAFRLGWRVRAEVIE